MVIYRQSLKSLMMKTEYESNMYHNEYELVTVSPKSMNIGPEDPLAQKLRRQYFLCQTTFLQNKLIFKPSNQLLPYLAEG